MTTAAAMIQRAKEIHQRLLYPPNFVKDDGIDLKRRKQEIKKEILPPVDNLPEVQEHQIAYCKVTIIVPPPKEHKPLKINPILRAVSAHYGILIQEIKGESRQAVYVRPRHVVFYIASRRTGMSVAAIARRFGRDHTTVLHAVRKMNERVLVDQELADVIYVLEARLLTGEYDDKLDQYKTPLAARTKSFVEKRQGTGLP